MNLKGEWSADVTYSVGDVVRYSNGNFYQMVCAGKAGVPCADALYWNYLQSPLQECAKMIMDIGAALVGIITDTDAQIRRDVETEFGMVAPEYTKTTYSKGDIVKHEGKLYEAKQNIGTAEDWTAAHWDEITVGGQLTALNAAAATIPTNISNEAITLSTATADYLVTVDDSGDDPELAVTAITEEGDS